MVNSSFCIDERKGERKREKKTTSNKFVLAGRFSWIYFISRLVLRILLKTHCFKLPLHLFFCCFFFFFNVRSFLSVNELKIQAVYLSKKMSTDYFKLARAQERIKVTGGTGSLQKAVSEREGEPEITVFYSVLLRESVRFCVNIVFSSSEFSCCIVYSYLFQFLRRQSNRALDFRLVLAASRGILRLGYS